MKVLITPRSFGKYNLNEMLDIFNKNNIEVIINPYGRVMTEEEISSLIKDVDAIIVGVDPLNEKVLSNAKKLKIISKYGVGLDNIDLNYTNKKGISVYVTHNANKEAVADYTFALLLSVARNLVQINNNCKLGNFTKNVSFDIFGKTIGILGFGAIGKAVARRAEGFGMKILVYDKFITEIEDFKNTESAEIDFIIKNSDFISLHLPLNDETKNILNEFNLVNAKENLIIINTARAGLISEKVLYDFVKSKKIYGAGVDVFEDEANMSNSKLLELDNIIVGSHTAASSISSINNMTILSTDNVILNLK